jgi:hypothetical protein
MYTILLVLKLLARNHPTLEGRMEKTVKKNLPRYIQILNKKVPESVVQEIGEITTILTGYLEKKVTGPEKDKFTLTDSNKLFKIIKDPAKLAEWHQTYLFYSRTKSRGKRDQHKEV